MNAEDHRRREEGVQARLALDAVSGALEARGKQVLEEAAALHVAGNLTVERAYALLVALLEQKRLFEALETAALHGRVAAGRIQQQTDQQAAEAAREKLAQVHGRNRFVRSRVPPRPRPETA